MILFILLFSQCIHIKDNKTTKKYCSYRLGTTSAWWLISPDCRKVKRQLADWPAKCQYLIMCTNYNSAKAHQTHLYSTFFCTNYGVTKQWMNNRTEKMRRSQFHQNWPNASQIVLPISEVSKVHYSCFHKKYLPMNVVVQDLNTWCL